MKSSMRKIIASVCLAFVFVCAAVISGVMLFTNGKSTNPTASSLAGSSAPSTITLEVDGKNEVSVSPGSTVKIKATYTTRAGRNWYAISSTLVPFAENNVDINYDVLDYISLPDGFKYKAPTELSEVFTDYKFSMGNMLASSTKYEEEDRGIKLGMYRNDEGVVDGSVVVYYEFNLIINENIVNDLKVDSITLGFQPYASNSLVTIAGTNDDATQDDNMENKLLAANTLTIKLRSENSGSDIGDIDIGVGGEDDDDIDIGSKPDPENPDKPYFDENGDVVIYLPDNESKTVKVNYPTMQEGSEGATVKAATSASKTSRPNASAFAKNEIGEDGKDIAVDVGKNVIHVWVTPEDGSDNSKYYTITCIFTYVRLSDLVPEADVSGIENAGDMNNGFKNPETFDKDTYVYEVYVPGDSTQITATVVEGYGASTTIELTATNCTVGSSSVLSKTPFTVSEIGENATLEMKVTAFGGNPDPNTHTYKLTFVSVSTDATLKELVVKGANLKMEAQNNSDKATENKVDYYYLVIDTDPVQALMTITANDSNAKVEVKGSTGDYSNYNATKKYDPDTYTIKITSEAGNYSEYTVMLTKRDFLKLIDNSSYDYLALLKEVRNGRPYQYRVSYSYLEWTHGLDDIYDDRFYDDLGWIKGTDDEKVNSADFNMVVLGHIAQKTVVSNFVQQIDPEQRNAIKVYNSEGTLIFENGETVSGLLTSKTYVGTGARVEYGTDVVYCSVLGDTSGDGIVNNTDVSLVSSYFLDGSSVFDPTYVKLAGLVYNRGSINSTDASILSSFINEGGDLKNYYNNYVKTV